MNFNNLGKKTTISVTLASLVFLAGCNATVPKVDLPKSEPTQKITSYSQALRDLGLMTEVYLGYQVKIMSNEIGDVTGAAASTGSEIPRDITEMTKSALNSIGGTVLYIPYDPSFVSNQMALGYNNMDDKIIPDVVISGGITEFDRALDTTGRSTELSISATTGGNDVSAEGSKQNKAGVARITLDFNMLDFRTMAGIPRMNAVNSMEVHKASGENGYSISLFGVTFGDKGTRKRVQGRHDAVRLLVQLSMIQMVGKYSGIPYWRVLGPNATPDPDVMRNFKKTYYRLDNAARIANVKEWLYLHGYEVPFTEVMDPATQKALADFGASGASGQIDYKTYEKLYLTLPLTEEASAKRLAFNEKWKKDSMLAGGMQSAPAQMPIALNISADKTVYTVGEEMSLSVSSNKDGFLRCYYQDGDNTIAQIYPNPFDTSVSVTGGRTTSIPPAKFGGGNFALEFAKPGVIEKVMCVVSENNFPQSIGAALLGPGLEAVNVNDLDTIQRTFEANLVPGTFAISHINVNVR